MLLISKWQLLSNFILQFKFSLLNRQKNKLYVVANYYPPGNDFQTFACNVKPIRKNKKDSVAEIKVVWIFREK